MTVLSLTYAPLKDWMDFGNWHSAVIFSGPNSLMSAKNKLQKEEIIQACQGYVYISRA